MIDSKRYHGRAEIRRPLLGQSKFLIDGHDRSKLVDELADQVELVRARLDMTSSEVPIRGALCFIDTGLPMLRTLTFKEFPLLYPRRLAKRINARGPLAPNQVDGVARVLAAAFPPA